MLSSGRADAILDRKLLFRDAEAAQVSPEVHRGGREDDPERRRDDRTTRR